MTHNLAEQHQDLDRAIVGRSSEDNRGPFTVEEDRPWCNQTSNFLWSLRAKRDIIAMAKRSSKNDSSTLSTSSGSRWKAKKRFKISGSVAVLEVFATPCIGKTTTLIYIPAVSAIVTSSLTNVQSNSLDSYVLDIRSLQMTDTCWLHSDWVRACFKWLFQCCTSTMTCSLIYVKLFPFVHVPTSCRL